MKYILAIDQGTSSSRCIIYDQETKVLGMTQQELTQIFPQPGWVEHDPMEIWQSQMQVCKQLMQQLPLNSADIGGIGITNQRETTVVWERSTGKPIYNAIVWQDRRTADECKRLQAANLEPVIKAKTGLLLDAYFSATKISWILDNVPGARQRAEQGELAFGTIDSWLVWNLTAGQLHITDVSNASRTLLYNIDTLNWDAELLAIFAIPASLLPEVRSSCEVYGYTSNLEFGRNIPITAIAGDQQAGLFGQLCIETGMTKCTYGTGSFLMMNTGPQRVSSQQGLLTTIAWQIGNEVIYALEGSIFIGGAVIQWLRDNLLFFTNSGDCEQLANTVSDNGGVYFVPAFTGLGAPHWQPEARGAIFGLTRGTNQAHITRAALESICFQVEDLLQILTSESGQAISQLRIDGGAAVNNSLAQFQADISALLVLRPATPETTAQGIAYLAGIAGGLWTMAELPEKWQIDQTFDAKLTMAEVKELKAQWLTAVTRVVAYKNSDGCA